MKTILTSLFALTLAGLVGCAGIGPRSSTANPVLYPNAALNKMGEVQAKAEVQMCVDKATAAGIKPAAENNAAARGGALAAATGAVAGVVGGLVTGRGIEQSVRQGVQAGAVSGAVGATHGAISGADQVNPVYRNFVGRCVGEKGLEVIGWQ